MQMISATYSQYNVSNYSQPPVDIVGKWYLPLPNNTQAVRKYVNRYTLDTMF